MVLSDLGASVIKVEMPGTGEPFRVWEDDVEQINPSFTAYNRGKRSVALNLKSAAGREAYRRLAASADVVLENYRPGIMDKLGLGYEQLSTCNERLIYCAVTGMGSSGPYRDWPTYDGIAQAVSGLWSQFTDMAHPEPVGPALSDQLTGVYAALAVLAALIRRGERTGPQFVEVSMLAASLAFLPQNVAQYMMQGSVPGHRSRPHMSQTYSFVASDGLPFAIHLSSPPKFWQGLVEVAGKSEWLEDPRFKTRPARIANYDQLHDALAEVFSRRPRGEWLEALRARDVPSAPLYTVAESLQDEHVAQQPIFEEFGQDLKLGSIGGWFQHGPRERRLPAPSVGQHTNEILDGLGYSQSELDRLRAEGAI
jgi:crotonobetainyl-CoA:carnitine CoA-transferase CaiB-like acyl-CoA transferase